MTKIKKTRRLHLALRDGNKCYYCGLKGDNKAKNLTVDHVRPQVYGGANVMSNQVLACKDCNSKKGSRFDQVHFEICCELFRFHSELGFGNEEL